MGWKVGILEFVPAAIFRAHADWKTHGERWHHKVALVGVALDLHLRLSAAFAFKEQRKKEVEAVEGSAIGRISTQTKMGRGKGRKWLCCLTTAVLRVLARSCDQLVPDSRHVALGCRNDRQFRNILLMVHAGAAHINNQSCFGAWKHFLGAILLSLRLYIKSLFLIIRRSLVATDFSGKNSHFVPKRSAHLVFKFSSSKPMFIKLFLFPYWLTWLLVV